MRLYLSLRQFNLSLKQQTNFSIMDFNTYKTEFLKIAKDQYSMEECDFSDEDIKKLGYDTGDSPQELMDWWADKYSLTHINNFSLSEATMIMSRFQ